jgi:hypothetical protein
MFYPKAKSMVSGAATQGVQAAQTAARSWLESAADYTTETVAPKVSSVLRDTARQISPPNGRENGSKNGRRSALRWSFLATAAFAAAGAVALLVRQRYRAAMVADTEDEAAPEQPVSAAGAEPTTPAGSALADGPAAAGVEDRISAAG